MKRSFTLDNILWKCLSTLPALLLILVQITVTGQSLVKGRLKDTASGKESTMAVIAILQPDSSLVRYTRSHKDGSFILHDIRPGNYLLMVTHPLFIVYVSPIIVRQPVTDMGTLALTPTADTLTPVIVTPRTRMPRLRGDTLEYNTSNIKTRVNATVEELLTRLPGVQVDEDGNITVNGEKVQRLTVDGKDFFGGDPSIVTRNFNADMIAKVQVVNKKSKQAEFTGVDDGRRTKTLNLQLKEDSKRGILLKVGGGGDMQEYYALNGLIASFNDTRQLAGLALAANTGTTGFSGNDGSIRSELNLGTPAADALGASAGIGIPRVAGAGMHYADGWDAEKSRITGNYKYGNFMSKPVSSQITRQTLPDSIYTQQQFSTSRNTNDQHNLSTLYEYTPDTVHALQFSLYGSNTTGHNELTSAGSSSFNDALVNSSLRNIRSEFDNQGFHANIMGLKRARKNKDRVLSLTLGFAHQDKSTKGYLYSLNNFYKPDNTILSTDTTDQRKVIISQDRTMNGNLNYTMPLWNDVVFALSYGLTSTTNKSEQYTNDRGNGKYNEYVDSLSTYYRNNVLTHQVTVNLQSYTGVLAYVIGGDFLNYSYRQSNVLKSSELKYQYTSFSPRINTRINISRGKGFNIDYNGTTQHPDISQLQSVRNNNDPLHITLGNPDLKPSFLHHFGLRYASFSTISFTTMFTLDLASHGFSTRTYVDSLGRQVSQTVNVDGTRLTTINCSVNSVIKPIEMNVGFNSNFSYNRSVNYINTLLSVNSNYFISGNVNLSKFVSDSYSISMSSGFAYTYSKSSVNLAHPIYYWSQYENAQLSFFLPKNFEINTALVYNWRQKLNDFDNRNTTLVWNAYAGKNFFKNQLSIRWQINDMLGQNAGITRASSANQTSENGVNVLGRYWLLTASWRIVQHGKIK